MIEGGVVDATCGDPSAGAAAFIQKGHVQSGLCQRRGAGESRYPRADDGYVADGMMHRVEMAEAAIVPGVLADLRLARPWTEICHNAAHPATELLLNSALSRVRKIPALV